MIESFRKKLKENGQSLTWFHRSFIKNLPGKKTTYTYFNMQVNDPERMRDNIKAAIENFLKAK